MDPGKKFVWDKVIGGNIFLIPVGIVIFLISLAITLAVYDAGWFFSLTAIGMPIGGFMVIYAIYAMINLPSNMIYKCWKTYGGNEAIVKQIQSAIDNKKKSLESPQLIISKGWIIKPDDFHFIKPADVDWVYLKGYEGYTGGVKQVIMLLSKKGIKLDVQCSSTGKVEYERGLVTKDVATFLNALGRICKNAFVGYSPEIEKAWKKSKTREEFLERIEKLIDANSQRCCISWTQNL
jgi:hypothetical protein